MGRKTQITKESMIQAAYDILREDGYSFVNIKSIAAKVGCSTQPISWQFGNMQELRKELYAFATKQIFGGTKERIANKNGMEAFFETGILYISNACEYPYVFRFLCVDDPGEIIGDNRSVTELLGDDFIKVMLKKELNLPMETIAKVVSDIVIYTHGLATMLLWDGFKMEKEQAIQMIYDHAALCFGAVSVDINQYITSTPISK